MVSARLLDEAVTRMLPLFRRKLISPVRVRRGREDPAGLLLGQAGLRLVPGGQKLVLPHFLEAVGA